MYIDHINIAAPAELLEEVKNFYCNALGFTEGFRPAFSKGGYWLYAQDKALIHLTVNSSHHGNEQRGHFDHFALRTTGVEKVLEQLNRYNIEYTTSYLAQLNLTQIFCNDPSGTGVEISFLNEPI